MVAVGRGGIAMRYSIDAEALPVDLPPIAEAIESAEPETPTVEEVVYHWDIIRQATWQTNFADTYFIDELTGWAVGSEGVIAHTTDGGMTWAPQHSSVKSNLNLVHFANASHGWITGRGMLLRTENGGKTWQVIKGVLQNARRISTMQFINAKEGWLGIGAGQTLHTTDGGLTWKRQQSGTTDQAIADLHFINSNEGWAIARERCEGGLILHTVNSGDYWQILEKTNQPGAAVHFADAKSGWVLMADGSSLITTDGGVMWKRITSDLEGRLGQIEFRSHTEAWAVGGNGNVFMTHDQGKTWETMRVTGDADEPDWFASMMEEMVESILPEPASEDEVPVVRENRFQTDGDPAEAFQRRLRDRNQRPGRFAPEGELGEGNENNNEVRPQQNRGERRKRGGRGGRGRRGRGSGQRIANAHFVNDQIAWAVGREAHIYRTTDGGKTWEHQLGSQALDDFRNVLFLNSQQGWIAGNNGLLLETGDGGKTWTTLQSGTGQSLVGVHFLSLDPKWGWVMGRDGTVFYTTDGAKWSAGQTPMRPGFLEDDPPRPFAINDVAFGKFSEGWAVGTDGQIIHNQDGGPVWQPQRTSTGKDLIDVDMNFAPLGWAVGHSGNVQRTINGGEYWKFHKTDTGYDLNAVSFIAKRKGWVAGRYGIILRATDGGFTWEALSSGVTQDLHGILALSETEIYAVGANGTIIHSTDAGDTWVREHTDISNNLTAITRAKDGNTLWVVGQWGVVLRREVDGAKMSHR
jgi:photosystem II stability/assembly factor-like uncharacterized protein